MNSPTILWHDYETWGTNPKLDFPVQFAAVRTDLELNVVGKEINWFNQIPNDYLPNPAACLVTGITPQASLQKGMLETVFAEKINNEMQVQATCTAGYNSIKFDEEVSRHLFYRNFLPVYEREYENNNSRWDLIDLVRAVHALRPEGINWPENEMGYTSFKLENLSKENNLLHNNAHDALSDVYATIGMAKLIKTHQPKMYEYYWSLRSKHEVLERLRVGSLIPVVYVAGTIKPSHGCITWVLPIRRCQANPNTVISLDLSKSIQPLIEGTAEDISKTLFAKQSHAERTGLTAIHINKCPFVAPAKMLTKERAAELGVDREQCLKNLNTLQSNPDLLSKVTDAYEYASNEHQSDAENVDEMLYSRGFPSLQEKSNMHILRNTKPEEFIKCYELFNDDLYLQQIFRFQGRNYPSTFNEHQTKKWVQHCRERLENGIGCLSITTFLTQLEDLYADCANSPKKLSILKSLYDFAVNK